MTGRRRPRTIGAILADAWPLAELLGVLPMQAAATPDQERFGIWLIVERDTKTVVGDIGFHGPPAGGRLEIGFSVIPERRRRGYAAEAAGAMARMGDGSAGGPGGRREVRCRERGSARTLAIAGFARVAEHDGQVEWRRTRG